MSDNNTRKKKKKKGHRLPWLVSQPFENNFKSKQIIAFVDDELERGEEIWPSLVKQLKDHPFQELVTILEFREKCGQIVIPVFYNVEPNNEGNFLSCMLNTSAQTNIDFSTLYLFLVMFTNCSSSPFDYNVFKVYNLYTSNNLIYHRLDLDNDDRFHQLDILGSNPCWLKWQFWPKQEKARIVYILAKRLKFLATEIRFLIWKNYPLKSFPEKFSAENFVILKLPYGRMKKVWDGVKINISISLLQFSVNSRNTKITISRRKQKGAEKKPMSDNSVPQTKYDVFVSFRGKDIRRGFLSHFANRQMLEFRIFNILIGTNPVKVACLYLMDGTDCKSHQSLPEIPSSLETLTAKYCSMLQNLPELLLSLENLDVTDCKSLQSLSELPLSLETLNASYCSMLQILPKLHLSLKPVDVTDCKSLQSLQEFSSSLKTLDFQYCRSLQTLPELPLFIKTLSASECIFFKTALFLSTTAEQLEENKKWTLYVCSLSNSEKLKGAEKKPMSDNSAPQTKYDVFVSFRGKDIRQGFLSHLIEAFKRKQINAFVDDKLERGERIWASLVGAIEGSSISLILFSPDYASSRWCLEELVKILECRETYGQIVIPVFYHVQPADVRHQLRSYKSAFAKHATKYKGKVQIWRHAMSQSADLSGIDSSTYSTDAEVLEAIVDLLLSKLAEPLVNSKGLVGINEKIADVESLIRKRKELNDICLVGICGMGGIGKTTLAEEIFYKLRSEYEGSCFLANEREQSSKRGIISLKNEIFSNLLGYVKINTERSLPNDIIRRIGRMEVLIVLDDVNDSNHIQDLLGTLDNFGSGSRIIVTTRDERVLNANKADEIYRLTELSFNEALQLFKLIAFHPSDHQREYDVLSKRMVHYAKGVPLVLKVLAHLLRGKNKEIWKSELVKLEKLPPKEVYEVLKMSYDDLDSKEQQIFLDLACFVLQLHRKVNVDNLKSLLKDDESDNSSVVAVLERLKDKALVTFSEDNFICIHDKLQEMGLEIVRQQSREHPGSASWLWDPNDICEALKNDKNLVSLKELDLNSSQMLKELPDLSKATNLEVLILWGCSQLTELHPSIFSLAKLKKLDLWNCKSLTTVGKYYYHLRGNRYLTHDDCKNLLEFSQMSKNMKEVAPSSFGNLLHVIGSDLKMLPSWLNNLTQLLHLEVSHCTKLQTIPELPQLLKTLDVRNCNSLESIPELPLSLETLAVEKCTLLKTLSEFPPSLKTLAASYCKSLQTLPELPQLIETLNVKYCKSLQTLPELPSSLQTLEVKYCESLQTLPEIPQFITALNFEHCTSLQSLAQLPQFLRTLGVIGCESLQNLPEFPPSLETLQATNCKSLESLPELPPSLKILDVSGCDSLQSLPEFPPSLETLHANNCKSLESLQELPKSLKTLNICDCESLQSLHEVPPSLQILDVKYCKSLESLPELPRVLKTLNVSGCESLQSLPELPQVLKTLNVSGCESLQSLPEFPPSLETLHATNCKSLESLPELPPSLVFLDVSGCESLQSLPELPWSLVTLDASYCESLKSVLVPSMAVEQLKENLRWVEFRNCFNLDEHSLGAIGLIVQINIMKFVKKNLSFTWHRHLKRKYFGIYEVVYVYPGSSVPEWLEYKTTKDNAIFDISFAPPILFPRFIFCLVFGNCQRITKPTIYISISGEGEGEKDRMDMRHLLEVPIESDHVCVVCFKGYFDFLSIRAKNETRFKMQVKIETDDVVAEEVLKGFGVSPIGSLPYS
ncbi:TMV resistance protein N, partial [Mucuna pruriens]